MRRVLNKVNPNKTRTVKIVTLKDLLLNHRRWKNQKNKKEIGAYLLLKGRSMRF